VINHRELLCEFPQLHRLEVNWWCKAFTANTHYVIVHSTGDHTKALMNKCLRLAETTEFLPIPVVHCTPKYSSNVSFFFSDQGRYYVRITNVQEATCCISHYQGNTLWDDTRDINLSKWHLWTLIDCYYVVKAFFPLYMVTKTIWLMDKLFVIKVISKVIWWSVLCACRIIQVWTRRVTNHYWFWFLFTFNCSQQVGQLE
jgi:hypothetical protein